MISQQPRAFYSFRWFAERIAQYGWTLVGIVGSNWSYLGKGLPYLSIQTVEKRVAGHPVLVIEKRFVDLFDECIQEIFGETLYDGSEEIVEGE